MSAYTEAHLEVGILSDEERDRLRAKAPPDFTAMFVEWAEKVLVQWQFVQDFLNPEGGDFEVVKYENDDWVFRLRSH